MMSSVPQTEPATPGPRPWRYRWRKRYWQGVILGLSVVAALRCGWGWFAERCWQQAIAERRARGELVLPGDFDVAPVPDPANAALLLIRAAEAVDASDLPDDWALRQPFKDLTAAQWQQLRDVAQRNIAACDLARQARRLPVAQWGRRATGPLGHQRRLATVLSCCVAESHHRGNDAEAVATVRDLLDQARHLEANPMWINHMVALAIDRFALRPLEWCVPDLTVGPAPAASREAVQALVASLLDDQSITRRFEQVLFMERALVLEAAGPSSGSNLGMPGGPSANAALFGPLRQLHQLRLAEHLDVAIEAGRRETLPEALAMLAPLQERVAERHLAPVASWFSLYSQLPAVREAMAANARVRTRRRITATALALRRYQLDVGRRPAELLELVPKYLPEVPLDPMASDGQAIRYRPAGPGPHLYSVGENIRPFFFRKGSPPNPALGVAADP